MQVVMWTPRSSCLAGLFDCYRLLTTWTSRAC